MFQPVRIRPYLMLFLSSVVSNDIDGQKEATVAVFANLECRLYENTIHEKKVHSVPTGNILNN